VKYEVPLAPPLGQRLTGRMVAVSVSVADDQDRLGFPPDHMDRVLQAILIPLVTEGAVVAYGGRIEHDHNYTLVISNHLGEAYRRMEQRPGQRPFVHFVAQHRFKATAPAMLLAHLQALAPYGEIWVTGRDGVLGAFAAASQQQLLVAACNGPGFDADAVLNFSEGVEGLIACPTYAALAADNAPESNLSFTQMRQQMAAYCHARIQVGGRSSGFSGAISGLCEEALLTLAAGRPLIPLGGFGGASRDIAIALELLDSAAAVPRRPLADLERYEAGLAMLRASRSSFLSTLSDRAVHQLRDLASTESLVEASQGVSRLVVELLT